MSNIIFFGPPGAGKGTQAKIISSFLNLPHLSTGDILRKKILENDSIALELKNIMDNGKLVSDDILNSIVSSRLTLEAKKGFILDGYPRTLDQSLFLDNFLKTSNTNINYIFFIDIKFNILQKRIIKRSKEENRDDDNLNILKTRYSAYLNSTEKVSSFYKEKLTHLFFTIDGSLEIDEITDKIKKILKKS